MGWPNAYGTYARASTASAQVTLLVGAPLAPDFQVTDLTVSSTATALEPLLVSWSVTNAGPIEAKAPWTDWVVLSQDPVIGNSDDVVLGELIHSEGMAAGATTSYQLNVLLPSLATGNYHIAVVSNPDQSIKEYTNSTNNTSAVASVAVTAKTALLYTQGIQFPESVLSGSDFAVSWEVLNTGNAPTLTTSWKDMVRLLDEQGRVIAEGVVSHDGLLAAQHSYVTQTVLRVPRDFAGQLRVQVELDIERVYRILCKRTIHRRRKPACP